MKRGKFSLSHYKLLTCNQGQLVPIGLTEILPGDSVQHATSLLLRTQPLVTPVMHPIHVRIHHWFVPHRLVWTDWEKFITGGPDGMDASVFPTRMSPASTGHAVGSLADYLGVPTGIPDLAYSALPFRGYQLIFKEWYRDQDLVTAPVISTASGPDTTTDTAMHNCAWEKDYFTSARPWAQKGPEVTLPLGTEAPVLGLGKLNDQFTTASQAVRETGGGTPTYAASTPIDASADDNKVFIEEDPNNSGFPYVRADLSAASAADINSIRLAMGLQRYQEARARYGSRYTEYLRYLGVRSSDARLQRPEYLGGGKQTVQISEVLQTSPVTDNGVVGSLKGHGIAATRTNRYRRFFEEHGYIFTILSIKPRTVYLEGLPRTWNRRAKEDFWQKELQHIGQQEILKKEIYAVGSGGSTDDEVFGYQDRYDEYRRNESSVHGQFRTNVLDSWHMARNFVSLPTLNGSFVTSDPTPRIYADAEATQLYIMAYHNMQARRLLSQVGKSYVF